VVNPKIAKPKVYLETSVLSYLAARPSRDAIVYGQQQQTTTWWESHRQKFALLVSEIVIDEAAGGDKAAAKRRLELIVDVPVLDFDATAVTLAERLVARRLVPKRAARDAAHIAIAAVHEVDYLLTWNFKHIGNPMLRESINLVIRETGYKPSVICSPGELEGEYRDVE
jgi:hypothetical protein